MRKKQASPDYRKADEMGVTSYIPKNQKKDQRVMCEWDYGDDTSCGAFATIEVTLKSADYEGRKQLCDGHAKVAQVEYIGTVMVRRRKY